MNNAGPWKSFLQGSRYDSKINIEEKIPTILHEMSQ